MSMLKNMATVSGFTLMSRLLGFLREIFMAKYLGASMQADAFFAAFRFPNMFRRIFGEGAFNAAFVPLFGRAIEEDGKAEAEKFASNAFSWLFWVLGIGSVVAIVGMRWVMGVFVFGFLRPEGHVFSWEWVWEMVRYPQGTEKFEITVGYSQIMFSYLTCMALAAHMSGVLNTLRIFAIPAFAPVLLNIVFLVGLAVLIPALGLTGSLAESGGLLAWCVFVAGFLQMGLLYWGCRRAGMRIRIHKPVVTSRMRRLGLLMIPGVLAAGIQQVNLFIGTQIASTQAGAVSFLYYADRINQLPLGMIGIAFGVVLLPEITRQLRGGNADAARGSMLRGIEFSMLLTLPAAVAMVVMPAAILRPILEYGEFTAANTDAAAAALAGFAIGLPSYVLAKVFQPGYFAAEDTKSPMYMAGVTVVVNIVFSLLLFPKYGHVGIAVATSIAGWVNVMLLAGGLRRRGFFAFPAKAWGRIIRLLLASGVMGLVLWFLAGWADEWLAGAMWQRFVALFGIVGVGLGVYGLGVVGFGGMTVGEVKGGFRRGSSK